MVRLPEVSNAAPSSSDEELLVPLDGVSAGRRGFVRPTAVLGVLVFGVALCALLSRISGNPDQGGALVQVPAEDEVEVIQKDGYCEILWSLSLPMMVAQGWGSRVWVFATINQRFSMWYNCNLAMPEKNYNEFHDWGLDPPGSGVSDYEAKLRNPILSIDPSFHTGLIGDWPAEALNGMWILYESTLTLMYQDLAGCYTTTFDYTIWKTFQAFFRNDTKPEADYIGVHVRHGDKLDEGPIFDLHHNMDVVKAQSQWATLKNVFVATDDANVLQNELPPYKKEGYNFTWATYDRHAGGEPHTCTGLSCHHDKDVRAALGDTLSLAHASVLVGNFNSNFFKLAWLLNYLRRTEEQRKEQWCWDVFTNRPCDDRKEFVVQFVDQARAQGVHLLPAYHDLLRSCDLPFKAPGCLEGVQCPSTGVYTDFGSMTQDLDSI